MQLVKVLSDKMTFSGKNQLILLALVSVIVAVSATNFISGSRRPKDGVVCYGDVNLRAVPGQILTAQRVCNVPRWNQTINYIVALDQGRAGKGGYAQIIKGGLNQKNVTLHIWSQKSQPLNFTIQVYATPYW